MHSYYCLWSICIYSYLFILLLVHFPPSNFTFFLSSLVPSPRVVAGVLYFFFSLSQWSLLCLRLRRPCVSLVFKQSLSGYPWLAWNSLCRLGWVHTQRSPVSARCASPQHTEFMFQLVSFMSKQSCFKDYVNDKTRGEGSQKWNGFVCHYNAEKQLRTENTLRLSQSHLQWLFVDIPAISNLLFFYKNMSYSSCMFFFLMC